MVPLVYQQGPESVVGAEDGNFLPVDIGLPSGRVVNLAEYGQSFCRRRHIVTQAVRAVLFQDNASFRGTGIFGGSALCGLRIEDDGLPRGVNLPESGHLRIGGRSCAGAFHEPGIAQTVIIRQGITVPVDNDVLGVEHGQDGIILQASLYVGDGGSRGNNGIDVRGHAVHLRCYVEVYQVLVPLELGGAVAAYGLVVVADDSVVEGIDAQVEDAVREVGVLMYGVVHRTGVELRVEIALGDEMVLVQIPLVHSPQIREEENTDDGHCRQSLQLPFPCREEHSCRQKDEDQRAEGIGAEEAAAVVLEGTDKLLIAPEHCGISCRGKVAR